MLRSLAGFLFVVILIACSPAVPSSPSPIPSSTPNPTPARTLTLGAWHDLIYHEKLGKVVLINGGPEEGKPASDPLELWTWDGERWSLASAGTEGPRWRNFASATYDSDRGTLVLYGGLQAEEQTFQDTWEWDGNTWTQRNGAGPGTREAAGMAYDSGRERVVLFGGAQSEEMMRDTWEWDGEEWSQIAADGPPARFPAAFVYDETNRNVVLFGGHAFDPQAITTYGDTWTWDGASWQQVASDGPSARDGADAVFHGDLNGVFLFGGAEIGAAIMLLDDTWLWDGNRWEPLAAQGPPHRVHPAMAFDAARGKVVLTGGSNAPGVVLRDTWEWDGQAWICVLGCN